MNKTNFGNILISLLFIRIELISRQEKKCALDWFVG